MCRKIIKKGRVRQTKGERSHMEIFRQKIKGKNPNKQ